MNINNAESHCFDFGAKYNKKRNFDFLYPFQAEVKVVFLSYQNLMIFEEKKCLKELLF